MFVKKFENWVGFDKKTDIKSNDEIKNYHYDWSSKYSFLKEMKFESDFINKEKYWIYSLDKNIDNILVFINIEIKRNHNWDIIFQLSLENHEEYLIDDNKNSSLVNSEKNIIKKGCDWETLNIYLSKIDKYLSVWNKTFYEETNQIIFKNYQK